MGETFDAVATALLQQGFPGIVILALGFVAYRLFGINSDLHEKRLTDSRTTIDAINKNTNSLESLTEILRDRAKG